MARPRRPLLFWSVWLVLVAALVAVAGYLLDPFGLLVPRVSGQITSWKDRPFHPEDSVTVSFVKAGERGGPAFGKDVVATVADGNVTFSVQLPPGRYRILISADTSKRTAHEGLQRLMLFQQGETLKASLLMLQKSDRLACEVGRELRQTLTIDLPGLSREATPKAANEE